jgi:dTDP-4-dehydrorhamnose reductase
MKALILGRAGQLGWALGRRLEGRAGIVSVGHDEIDLAGPADAIERLVDEVGPDVVFNAAAHTAVDRAETERETAFAINARAPAALASACARRGALLLHWSTDYVYDGAKPTPWVETDPTGPLNVYGASKLAGDEAVIGSDAAAIVLRTSWVFGDHGGNFAKTMLRLAIERDALRVVGDQVGAPTWAGRLADVAVSIVDRAVASGDAAGWLAARRGVYHCAASGETSWADYARCVLAAAADTPAYAGRLKATADRVEAIPSSAYPTPAARPMNSRLDCSKLRRVFGVTLPDWREDVTALVKRLGAAA